MMQNYTKKKWDEKDRIAKLTDTMSKKHCRNKAEDRFVEDRLSWPNKVFKHNKMYM